MGRRLEQPPAVEGARMMSALMKSDMTWKASMKPKRIGLLIVMALMLVGFMVPKAFGQSEPPSGCGAAQAVSPEDCMRCHAVPGFDPSAVPMDQPAVMPIVGSMALAAPLAAASGRVTTWEVNNVDEASYRLHWEVNGYVMRFSIYRLDGAIWSLVYDNWPWNKRPRNGTICSQCHPTFH